MVFEKKTLTVQTFTSVRSMFCGVFYEEDGVSKMFLRL